MKRVALIVIILIIIVVLGVGATAVMKTEELSLVANGNFQNKYQGDGPKQSYDYYLRIAQNEYSKVLPNLHEITIEIGDRNLGSRVLAQAYANKWNERNLATSGIITINGRIFNNYSENDKIFIMKHELGHILGIGETNGGNPREWSYDGNRFLDSKFTKVLAKYREVSDDNSLDKTPVEGTDQAAHWENDDRSFGGKYYPGVPNEIMVARIGGAGRISSMTVAFFEELGYEVDYSEAQDEDINGLVREFRLDDEVYFGCDCHGNMTALEE